MRLWALLFLLMPLTACSKLFGLDEVTTDAPVDMPSDIGIDAPSCENSAPFGSTCRTITLPLTEDSYLSSTEPTTSLGQLDALRTNATEPGLFKFYAVDIAPDERIAEMTLELDPYFGMGAKACNDTDHSMCLTCPPADIGVWHIAYVRTDWLQSQATWNEATSGVSWHQPGAAAIPDDRSAVIATGPGVSSGLLDMKIPGSALLQHSPDCYRTADSLALLVETDGLAYFEAQEVNFCSDTTPNTVLPNLTVTLCK